MKLLKRAGTILIAGMLALGFAGCGSTGGGDDKPVVRDPSDTSDYKMNEMTTINVGLSWNSDWYYDGIDHQNNPIYDLYKSAENINVVNKFALGWSGYEQQIGNGILDANALPDAFFADQKMLDELIRANRIVDMKPYYDLWATDELKETLGYNDNKNFAYAERDGKLYGIPAIQDDCNRPIIWIRSDWLNTLNSKPIGNNKKYDTENDLRFHEDGPKSIDEFWDMAYAFALEDPDGNGKRDTYGLSLSKYLDDLSLPIFNAYGAYPDVIEKQEDGSYKNLALEDEMVKPLEMLQQAVKDFVIPSDYYNWDGQAALTKAGNGVIGMAFAVPYSPLWPLNNALSNDKTGTVDWIAAPMITADGSPFIPSRKLNATGFYVVKKGYEHPEVVIKMLNNMATKDPENAWYQGKIKIDSDPKNSNAINWMPIRLDRSTVNFERSTAVVHAIDTWKETGTYDESKIAAADMPTWQQVKAYNETKSFATYPQGWAYWKTWYEGVPVAKSYHEEGEADGASGKYNDWIYPPTKTLKKKGPSLETITNTFRINAISNKLGGKTVAQAFENFKNSWLNGGGGQILLEMQKSGH